MKPKPEESKYPILRIDSMLHQRLEPITDHIFLIKGENQGRFPFAHSILILNEENVLIDTGCGIKILQELKHEHDISYVINSHNHVDHSSGNWVFRGHPIFVPYEGKATSGNIAALSERFVNQQLAPIWRQFIQKTMGFQNCPPTHTYNEKQPFCIGNIVLRPIYTPGHTIDHYCFYKEDERILFSFDYDLTSFPWYGHKESNLADFRQSIMRLKALAPQVVVTSHRGIITSNIDTEFDFFSQRIDERNDRILDLLDYPQRLEQLIEQAPIYQKFPYAKPLLRYWEGQMISKHLQELEQAGRVQRREGTYIRVEK